MRTWYIILILLICLGICFLIKYAFFLVLICLIILMYRGTKTFYKTKEKLLHQDSDDDINDKYHYTER